MPDQQLLEIVNDVSREEMISKSMRLILRNMEKNDNYRILKKKIKNKSSVASSATICGIYI